MGRAFLVWTALMAGLVAVSLYGIRNEGPEAGFVVVAPVGLWIVGLMFLAVIGVARQDARRGDKPLLACENCGAAMYRHFWDAAKGGYVCRRCGTVAIAPTVDAAPLPTGAGTARPSLVWSYEAKAEDDASIQFRADAPRMGAAGYYPASQTWAAGRWGLAPYLAALFLSLWLIGIPILIYLLIVKPKGTLTVTYKRPPPGPAIPTESETRT